MRKKPPKKNVSENNSGRKHSLSASKMRPVSQPVIGQPASNLFLSRRRDKIPCSITRRGLFKHPDLAVRD